MKLSRLVLLASALLFVVSQGVFAFSGSGAGTSGDPYQITTKAQLLEVNTALTKSYKLMNDIDLGGASYTTAVLASPNAFEGTFDGNGKVISNYYITSSSGNDGVGFFGELEGTVKNLGLESFTLSANSGWGVGSLAGNTYGAYIFECYVQGAVTLTTGISSFAYVGGLVGAMNDESYISNCWSSVAISGVPAGLYAAGISGTLSGSSVENCYSTGTIVGSASSSAGIVGDYYGDEIIKSYWDTTASGLTKGVALESFDIGIDVTGRTTAQMGIESNFVGWDFTTPSGVWYMPSGAAYPLLRVFMPPVQVSVPDVVNMEQPMAEGMITASNLVVGTVTMSYSNTVAIGNVISQTPTAGTLVDEGTSVDLAVSLGKPAVPDLLFKTQVEAEAALTDVSLVLGTVTQEFSDIIPLGRVVSQNPAEGVLVNVGSAVNIVISKGPEVLVSVPDVVGLDQASAEMMISGAGLVASVTTAYNDTVPAGNVISQDPISGVQVSGGSTVILVVSDGPEPVLVPNLSGMTQAQATNALVAAGLTSGTITPVPSTTVAIGYVVSQAVASGTPVLPGTGIGFSVSTGTTVPNITGMTEGEALTALANAGLVSGAITDSPSTTVAIGDIISQTIASGSVVNPGTAVGFVLSTGTTVPNITGMTEAEATTALTTAGLTVGTVSQSASTTVMIGDIISQTIAAGTIVDPSTAVGFTVSTGVAVPDLSGMTQAEATVAITAAGLTVGTVTTEVNAAYSVGDVISQTPASGVNVNPGTAVDLLVAEGVAVPNIVGLTEIEAGNALTAAGLTVGNVSQSASTTVAIGLIMSQSVAAGIKVEPNTGIDFVVSTGTTVPDVVGSLQADAQTAITNAGLVVGVVTTAPSTEYDAGEVISQSVVAGSVVDPGNSVDIVVSAGVTVPNIIGLTEAEATTALTNAGLTAGTITPTTSTTVMIGNVISQVTAAGTQVNPNTAIAFAVSTGTIVPDITGMTEAEATTALTTAGLTVGTVSQSASTTVMIGDIISQSVASGSAVNPGTAVNFEVSTGTTVPDVTGMTEAEAETTFTNLGLVVVGIGYNNSTTVMIGKVISQSLIAGQDVNPGTSVTFEVSLGTTVPDITGMTEAEATTALTTAGLAVGTVSQSASTTVMIGDIISQSVASGSAVNPGTAIDFAVSTGTTVPDITGMTQAQAVTALGNAGLVAGVVSQEASTTVNVGDVISQSVASGTVVEPGATVAFVVSTGVVVPSIVGITETEASDALISASLTVGTVSQAYSDTVEVGLVISQAIAAGTNANPNAAVDFVVSLGVEPVYSTIPDISGMTLIDAQVALAGVNLTIGTVTQGSSDTIPAGSIISSNPAAGESVLENSAISVIVSVGPYTGGTGTEIDPFLIATTEDLEKMGERTADYDKSFKLISDLDLSDTVYDWSVIARPASVTTDFTFDGTAFSGTFDGNSHSITGLTINTMTGENAQPGKSFVGLFGKLSDTATVTGLVLRDVNITGRASRFVGAIAGISEGVISECGVEDAYINAGNQSMYAGGIVGRSYQSASSITNCYFIAGTGNGVRADVYGGGIVGDAFRASVTNCYVSNGTIDANYAGPISGRSYIAQASNSYWDSMLVVNDDEPLAAYTGRDVISSEGENLTSMTTAEMLLQATYIGWDFANVWIMPANSTPKFALIADFNRDAIVNQSDLAVLVGTWLQSGTGLQQDFNYDGFIDINDYAIFAGYWMQESN